MKLLIVLCAALVAVAALPSGFGNYEVRNATRNSSRSVGFASFGSGTQGGEGGSTWTVWDAFALRDAVTGNDARIITVRGSIDMLMLFVESPGVMLDVGSWKTIIGGDSDAEITGGGLRILEAQQVIIRNIRFNNALSLAPGESYDGNGGIINQIAGAFTEIDAILCQASEYVWIDHNEFSDDPFISVNVVEGLRHDGLVDIKRGSNYVTVSNNIFRNHNKVILLGHNDNNAAQDIGKLKTTFVGNWFQGVNQRSPRVRYGEVHVLNNLYTDIINYGIGVGAGASIYAESNAFVNTRRSWGYPAGTPNPIGNLFPYNNNFVDSTFDSDIPSDVNWVPTDYYQYTPEDSALVEAQVRANAGILNEINVFTSKELLI